MKNEVKFILPNFLTMGRNELLIKIFEKHRECLRFENSRIHSFYGSFPKAIWNGGRTDIEGPIASVSFMKKVRDFYNKRGYAVTFTFTNKLIKEEHLDDEYCNKILEVFHNGKNEVLVASDLLESYIRENYPKYKINRSITASHDKEYDYDKYSLVVINKKYNHDMEYLKSIKNIKKVEILCDEVCVNDCPYTEKHYREISEVQLGEKREGDFGKCRFASKVEHCKFIRNRNKFSKYYISPEQISEYSKIGIEYFKLSGRERYNFIGLESIVDYLIKPEYQNDIRTFIVERMLMEYKKEYLYNLKTNPVFIPMQEIGSWSRM